MVGHFVELSRRKDLKVNGGEWRVFVDGMQLDHVSKFKYLGYVLD